ncbi:SAM-dependent methyltransferase [Streptococcus suis]|uniref:SAM-dependent methyltransferase n=1 Tax=Streptococcus suis TaxID=1307 RepID=A0A0Z8M2H9_STRSU|nr:SAM-dependent methyltransferase [Streptococcus suis]CYW01184.1 SAM-dependent methyltransferase [Streptococcus suis]
MTDYVNYNQERWNRVSARQGNAYTVPLSHEEFLVAKVKPLSVSLTVGKTVPLDWFEKAQGKKLLGLACGGGQQGPIFAAHGYETTILDFSKEQLDKDRLVAE